MADESGNTAGNPGSGGEQTLTNVEAGRGGVVDPKLSLAPAFTAGQLLAGRYKVERFLARGGMGEVYQVHDQELDESVALKTILPRSAGDPMSLDRFRREIQIARKVSHRNVCRIFDLGRHVQPSGEDVVFLTMELLHGESLRARLREGVMSPKEALDLVEQLSSGLAAAHSKGIVHRDLKPSNIFLVPEGDGTRVVIADFGLARTEIKEDGQLTVTGTGEILGTPAYMSPEQIEGRSASTASDIYSLGLVMYEMLTGTQPFEGESAFQKALNKLREAPTSPSTRVRGLPVLWDRTILCCLEKEPSDRFVDVEQIPLALAGGRRVPPRSLRRLLNRPSIWIPSTVVLLVVVVAVLSRVIDWPPLWGGGTDVEIRQSVAVLGFENNRPDEDTDWMAIALGHSLTTDLAAGGQLRVVPSQSVDRARNELGIEKLTTLAPETLQRVRELLGADLVVLGSYTIQGEGDHAPLRLDYRVQDVDDSDPIVIAQASGRCDELFEIAEGAAAEIRAKLGLDSTAAAAAAGLMPSDPTAARLYSEGVARMRSYDPQGAREKLERAAEADPNSPLVWLELAKAWAQMGYGDNAIKAARRARELSGDLEQEFRLSIEGQYQLLAGRDKEAVESFRSLWLVYPDNPEYGIRLAQAQSDAGMAEAALVTVEELRALPKPLGDDPRIDLAQANAAEVMGDSSLQAEAAERVVEEAGRIGSRGLEARGRLVLGSALLEIGDPDRALGEIEAAREIEESIGNRAGVGQAHYALALVHASVGSLDLAMSEIDASLEAARQAGASAIEADGLNLLGSIHLAKYELDEALGVFATALALQRDIGNLNGQVDALNNIAVVRMSSGDLSGAADVMNDVRVKCRELGSQECESVAVLNLARIYIGRGDLDGSRRSFEEAAGLARNLGDRQLLAEALFELGEVLLTQGDLAGARTEHEEALEIRREIDQEHVILSEFALGGVVLGEAALGRTTYDHAVDVLAGVVAALAEQGRSDLEPDALNYLAEAQIGAGSLDGAEDSLRQIEELGESAHPVTVVLAEINRAKIAGKRGDMEAAEEMLAVVIGRAKGELNLGIEFEARLARGELLVDEGLVDEAKRELDSLRQDAVARGWIFVVEKVEMVGNRLE